MTPALAAVELWEPTSASYEEWSALSKGAPQLHSGDTSSR